MKTKLVGAVLLWLLMNASMSFARKRPICFRDTRANGITCPSN